MVDANKILREYLVVSGTSLYTLVGTRIDTVGNYDNSQPFIVFARRGGPQTPIYPLQTVQYQFKCFGGVTAPNGGLAAQSVAGALYDRLHAISNESTTNGYIVSAIQQQGAQDLVDPDTRWPFVLVYYLVQIRSKT